MGAYLKLHAYFVSFFQSSPNLTKSIIFHWQCEATIIVKSVGKAPGGGGEYSHTLPIRVCAAQRGGDFEAPDLERGIHFRGVF